MTVRNWTDSSIFWDDRRIKICTGREQSLLPLPNFSRKIEGDSVRRVLPVGGQRLIDMNLVVTEDTLPHFGLDRW